jgi:hypothetical protein
MQAKVEKRHQATAPRGSGTMTALGAALVLGRVPLAERAGRAWLAERYRGAHYGQKV